MSNREVKRIANRKRLSLYNNRVPQEDGTNVEEPNLEYWSYAPPKRNHDAARRKKPYNTAAKGAYKGKKPRSNDKSGGQKPHDSKVAAKRQVKLENSPFAALAALKSPSKSGDKS
ncbi:hypothetical protein AB8615_09060 [Litorimonas sp. RW-G-Af-16]|uniref:hypothetical protein n=1 Tax=Litorimonas sp. RW-G-Af-16 TaxID=3241168 RepID=UPI003AAEC7AA